MSAKTVALETALENLKTLQERNAYVNTLYQTGTIVGLGVTFYGLAWAYVFFTNVGNDLAKKMSETNLVSADYPVHPYLATEKAADQLWEIWGGDKDNLIAAINFLDPNSPNWKMRVLLELQPQIDTNSGLVSCTHGEYMLLKKAEQDLINAGMIKREEAIPAHPVDKIFNFILNDKIYWGGVIGLAGLPVINLAVNTLKEIKHEDT